MIILLRYQQCLHTVAVVDNFDISFSTSPQPPLHPKLSYRSYSPSYCHVEHCTANPIAEFTIHGLWPQFSAGGWPQFCDKNHTDISSSLLLDSQPPPPLPGFHCNWPSFQGSDDAFWDHEWEKHGTCSSPVLVTRQDYMDTVLNLHTKFNINTVLSRHGWLPQGPTRMRWRSGSTSITTTDGSIAVPQPALIKAISESYGANPVLHCNRNNEIMEIWMCLDLELNVIECPGTVGKEEQCSSTISTDKSSTSTSSLKIIIPGGQAVSLACKRFFPPTLEEWWFFNTSILVLSFLAGFVSMTMYWKYRRCIVDEDEAGDLYERLYHI